MCSLRFFRLQDGDLGCKFVFMRKFCRQCERSFKSVARRQRFCSPLCTWRHRMQSFLQEKKVSKSCWNWPGAKQGGGYGVIVRDGHVLKVHRLAYEAFNGVFPDSLQVCHHCDNPTCCNPSHLFVGTHQDNMRDRDMKGRCFPIKIRRGTEHHASSFTDDDIAQIRSSWRNGSSMRRIARQFQVTHEAIRKIVRRESWFHLP